MSRETIEITCEDVANALNLFEKLEYGQGKAAAGIVVNAVVRKYTTGKLAPLAESRGPLSAEEIAACRRGDKLRAVKLLRERKGRKYNANTQRVEREGMSLMECKHYIEKHGLKYLVESGRYTADGRMVY